MQNNIRTCICVLKCVEYIDIVDSNRAETSFLEMVRENTATKAKTSLSMVSQASCYNVLKLLSIFDQLRLIK